MNKFKKSTILWSISLAGFMILYMAFYSAMAKDSAVFELVLSSIPKEMLQALGLSDVVSLASLSGYFALTFSMLQLAIAIQSSIYGVSILSEEERELTADFLLSKPVSRSKIYLSKLLAALTSLLITATFVALSAFFALMMFGDGTNFSIYNVFILVLTIPIFQLVFLSVGMFISLLMKKVRSVLSIAMGLSIGLYVVNSVRNIVDSDILGLLSPFYYFDSEYILTSRTYNLGLFTLATSIIVFCLLGSFILYNKRDSHSL